MSDALKSSAPQTSEPVDGDLFKQLIAPLAPLSSKVAIAVSGGPDSMALALCIKFWGQSEIVALIVDHGLREASSQEANLVKERLLGLGIATEILTWDHVPVTRALHEKARAARYKLLTDACKRLGINELLVAHNREDQAETVLMRVSKGSGIEGLAGMNPVSLRDDVRILRPFLTIPKARLIATCENARCPFVSDPSNQSERFARGRLRKVLPLLAQEGFTLDSLITLSERAAESNQALDFYVKSLLTTAATFDPGSGTIRLEEKEWRDTPRAIALRGLSLCLRQIHSGDHPPERVATLALLQTLLHAPRPTVRSLYGCLISLTEKQILIMREPAPVTEVMSVQRGDTIVWDRRWRIEVRKDVEAGSVVKALGSPPHSVIDHYGPGLRRRIPQGRVRSTLPALWHQNILVGIPSLSPDAPLHMSHLKQAFP